jgi:hypothetical protein
MDPAVAANYILIMLSKIDPSYCVSGEFPTMFPRVTPHMVRSMTVELAIRAGRSSFEIRQRDYEQAMRELTGETDFDRQQAVLYPGQ